MNGEWVFIVIIVCGLFLYGWSLYRFFVRKKEREEEVRRKTAEPEKTEKSEEKEKPPVVRYSPDYTTKKPAAESHKIDVILKDSSRSRARKWLCPNCEVENSLMDDKCCVCNYRYK